MILPKEKTQPRTSLRDYITLIYGEPKIGKTTFASEMDDPLFLATEAGQNALSVYQVEIPTWEAFLTACQSVAKGDHEFKTIVIDTIDNLFDLCSAYMRKKYGFDHESDLEYGKGWSMVADEFKRVLTRLSLLPYGLVFISHAKAEEIKTRTGTRTKFSPTLPNTARRVVLPMVDFILFFQPNPKDEGPERIICTRSTDGWEAGMRGEPAKIEKMPAMLPLSYNHFKTAFDGIFGGNG